MKSFLANYAPLEWTRSVKSGRMSETDVLSFRRGVCGNQPLAYIASGQVAPPAEDDSDTATENEGRKEVAFALFADVRDLRVVSGQYAKSYLKLESRLLRLFVLRMFCKALGLEFEDECDEGEEKMKDYNGSPPTASTS